MNHTLTAISVLIMLSIVIYAVIRLGIGISNNPDKTDD
ncbi:YnaM/YnfT family protein [Salmonella enterica]|nr:YnaM/YnfT family protein [Salmonella enterica]